MKRMISIAVSAFMLVALTATVAEAGTTPKTTGSVLLSEPTQYLSYDAFQSNPVKGSVSYTNFTVAWPGTGVWVPTTFNMGFAVDPSTTTAATYAMTVASITATSPTSLRFAGTGTTTGWNASFTGTISGGSFAMSMTEINAANSSETYDLLANGTIASNGSISGGTWSDNYGTGRTGTFVVDDIGFEAYHYTAAVTSTSVTSPHATFSYVHPFLGSTITVNVHDGGSPGAGNDTLTFVGIGTFAIVGGNLNVFA